MKTALIAGSTGLIGKQLLQMLLNSDRYSKVVAITRNDLPAHPKLVVLKVEFEKPEQWAESLIGDDVFCCLGTTMAKAESKENFYKVDFSYPLFIAKAAHSHGAKQYLLVSALGANKESSIYYNRVKGEIEDSIKQIRYKAIHIFRPSLLLGSRDEKRSGEDAAKIFYKIFGFLIPKKYQAIDSHKVAKAMITLASQDDKGIFIHESKELQSY
jgi:uncharacterized protein YbjT (DUF2867 family)